jgi:hypothetical protein
MRIASVMIFALLWAGSAFATDTESGNAMLTPCKNIISQSNADLSLQGVCAGIVDTLIDLGGTLRADMRFCPPKGVSIMQSILVSNRYMEKHPEMLHINFKVLAIRAFKEAWPCPK